LNLKTLFENTYFKKIMVWVSFKIVQTFYPHSTEAIKCKLRDTLKYIEFILHFKISVFNVNHNILNHQLFDVTLY